MELTTLLNDAGHSDLLSRLNHRAGLTSGTIFPFSDFTHFLCELIRWQAYSTRSFAAAGPIRPDVEIAVDRAEQTLSIFDSVSPFTYDLDRLMKSLAAADTIFYLANPNRVTGANMTKTELSELITANRGNLCIIDEYYFDHCGITALETAESTNNVLVLRSFNSSFDNRTSSTGYAVGSCETIEQLGRYLTSSQLSLAAQRTMMAVSLERDDESTRIKKHNEESIRLTSALGKLGIQCRLAPADFILLRVADPQAVCEKLNRRGVVVEELSDHTDLEHYLRYELRSTDQNDEFLDSLRALPEKTYRMKRFDRRPASISRAADDAVDAGTKRGTVSHRQRGLSS